MIRKLCEKYTALNDSDIIMLEDIETYLPALSDLLGNDLFIDCLTADGKEAIVVAECKPASSPSLYKGTVVGQKAWQNFEPGVLRTLKTGVTSRDLKAITQENRTVRQTVVALKNKENETIGVIISERDITEKILQERQVELLEDLNEKLTGTLMTLLDNPSVITQHLTDSILIFDNNDIAIHANPQAKALYKKLGYIDNIVGMELKNLALCGDDCLNVREEFSDAESEVVIGSLTLKVRYVFLGNNSNISMIMLVRDISEMLRKDKELILKSVAMQEIHHRIKNNLQTVASVLNLQARRNKNPHTKQVLQENVSRVMSIAATHEILARHGIDEVEIKTLLDLVKDSIIQHAAPYGKKITITVEGDNFFLPSDVAANVALIVNELITNALAHAFSGAYAGNVVINAVYGEIFSHIRITDDGAGFDPDKAAGHDSLGLSIVKTLVKDKLGGDLIIKPLEHGTEVRFNFCNRI